MKRNLFILLLLVGVLHGCSYGKPYYWPPYKSVEDECRYLSFFFLNNTSLDMATPEKGVGFYVGAEQDGCKVVCIAAYGWTNKERERLKLELFDAANSLLVSQPIEIIYYRTATTRTLSPTEVELVFSENDIIDSTGPIMTEGCSQSLIPTVKRPIDDSLIENSGGQLRIVRRILYHPDIKALP